MKDQQDIYVDWLTRFGGAAKDMTLRDYFAAARVSSGHIFRDGTLTFTPEGVARQAYQLADAMLRTRGDK
jgi:hypothetical protein